MKQNRQAAILELVEKYDIDTQEGMLARLKEEGFTVTQATVSRDIRELKLVKESGKDGKVRYALTAKRDAQSPKFNSALTESIVRVDYAGNLIVVKTYPGLANAVATCIDSVRLPEIIGCVAGDDAILVVVKTEADAASISESFRTMIRTI